MAHILIAVQIEIRYGINYIAEGCNDALGRIKRKKESKRFLKGMKIDLRQKVKDKNNSCCYNGIQAPLVFMLLVISCNQNSFDHKSHKHQQYNIILCNLKDYLPSLLLYLSSKRRSLYLPRPSPQINWQFMEETIVFK